MNTQALDRLQNAFRTIALWASAAAVLIFRKGFFGNDSNLSYHLQRFLTGREESIDLPVYLGLIVAVFFGYLIACKKRLAGVGGAIAVIAVLAIFSWCEFYISISLSPFLLALLGPALFHLASASLQRIAARQNASAQTESQQFFEHHLEPTEPVMDEHSPAVTAA